MLSENDYQQQRHLVLSWLMNERGILAFHRIQKDYERLRRYRELLAELAQMVREDLEELEHASLGQDQLG